MYRDLSNLKPNPDPDPNVIGGHLQLTHAQGLGRIFSLQTMSYHLRVTEKLTEMPSNGTAYVVGVQVTTLPSNGTA